jgi:hypothetical protein
MIHFFLACLIKFLYLFFGESSIYALDGVFGNKRRGYPEEGRGRGEARVTEITGPVLKEIRRWMR